MILPQTLSRTLKAWPTGLVPHGTDTRRWASDGVLRPERDWRNQHRCRVLHCRLGLEPGVSCILDAAPVPTLAPSAQWQGVLLWSADTSKLFDPSTKTWNTNVATTIYGNGRLYGTSVLLPLTPADNYDPQVIIMGGDSPATNTTEIIDMGASAPAWQWGPDMSEPRIEMNAVILPDGRVLAVGGSVNDEDTRTASLNADLLGPDPNNNGKYIFLQPVRMPIARLYHSVALLLPDATVWFAGGNPTADLRAADGNLSAAVPVQLNRAGSTAFNHERAKLHLLWKSVHDTNSRCGEYSPCCSGT